MPGKVNTRYDQLMEGLGWWDESTPDSLMLLELVSSAEENRAHVEHALSDLEHDIKNVRRMLSRTDPIMNTVGELQQRPAVVEAAVGAFAESLTLLRRFLEIHGHPDFQRLRKTP